MEAQKINGKEIVTFLRSSTLQKYAIADTPETISRLSKEKSASIILLFHDDNPKDLSEMTNYIQSVTNQFCKLNKLDFELEQLFD